MRGSHDFETTTEYEIFVADIVERRNRRIKHLLVEEQRQLHRASDKGAHDQCFSAQASELLGAVQAYRLHG